MRELILCCIFFLALVLVTPTALAQLDTLKFSFRDSLSVRPKYNITGSVVNAEGSAISEVSILVNGRPSGRTDTDGKYYLELTAGKYFLELKHVSMLPQLLEISLYGNAVIKTELADKRFSLNEVVVHSEGINQNVTKSLSGTIRMDMKELKSIPAFMGEADILKGLQLMPGVTSVGEGSAGMNVRGGQTDQNLILMNDVLVLNSNHALGFLSSFNPDMVQNFTLYKGNIPSYYGGRASSALNIEMRDGSFTDWKFSGTLGTSLYKFLVDGPVIKNKVSILTGLRLSNVNWLLRKVRDPNINQSNLKFGDIYSSVSVNLGSKTKLNLNTIYTSDSFQFAEEFGYDWSTSVSSLSIKSLLSPNLSIYGLVAYGDFNNGYFEPTGVASAELTNGINYWQGKITGLISLPNNSISVGVEVIRYGSDPEKIAPYTKNSGTTRNSVKKDSGIELASFISDELTPFSFLGISMGLRFSSYKQLGPDSVYLYQDGQAKSTSTIEDTVVYDDEVKKYHGIEPRISIRISLAEHHSIKLSYSRLIQYIQSISNTSAPTPIDLWQVSSYHIKPQISDNASFGYFNNLKKERWSTSFEVFYRQTENKLDYKDFASLFMNSHIETEIVLSLAKAYGAEFLIRKNKGNWTGWLSYTYSRTLSKTESTIEEEQINDGMWYPSNYDKPHVASIVLNRKMGLSSSLNFSATYSTGRPISAVSSTYLVKGVLIPNYSNRNEYRIPDYFRIDLACQVGGIFKKIEDNLNISIYNILSRRNAYSVFFKPEGASKVLKPYRLSILGTIFPSITYTVTF